VIINKFSEGIFYSQLVCTDSEGNIHEIDSRTSDAVALAIRFGSPLYTYENIIQQTGVTMDKEEETSASGDFSTEKSSDTSDNPLSENTLTELEGMIKEAIEKEDYEKASVIQKEINKRKKKK